MLYNIAGELNTYIKFWKFSGYGTNFDEYSKKNRQNVVWDGKKRRANYSDIISQMMNLFHYMFTLTMSKTKVYMSRKTFLTVYHIKYELIKKKLQDVKWITILHSKNGFLHKYIKKDDKLCWKY